MSYFFIAFIGALLLFLLYHAHKTFDMDRVVISQDLEDLILRINGASNKGMETILLNRFKSKMTELYELEYGRNYVLALDGVRVKLFILDFHAKQILGGVITPRSSFREFFKDKICVL